ncbi:hypothetical protein [Kribbella sp.]|uniref:hypothetical protein n=1 Tax=Kribbella sp. TaxID=1871183 RepID=UPI002D293284|nr:hypothetical protein [Kribbella sp.]HZX06695.1 hypothetical protein [Kribbella sp.]
MWGHRSAGLPQKPILDIAVGAKPSSNRDAVDEALRLLGFIARATVDDAGPTRKFGWEDVP